MSFFKHIEGEAAIVVNNGVYRQCDLYERDGYLYAKVGNGFVRLMSDGATTKPKTRLETLSWTGDLNSDRMGRLCRPQVKGSKLIDGTRQQLLLGAPEE